MPYFSIVMPTRNRGHLLRFSLQSAIEQQHDDYEIVVSDNSSSDETAKVVEELKDHRVRYFNTGRRLSMADNWEFALERARGTYVAYLSDDDALTKNALTDASRVIAEHKADILSWTHATYFSNSHPIMRWRNQLALPRVAEGTEDIDSKVTLGRLFALRADPTRIPRMLNGCCHRRVVEEVRAQTGRFFFPVAPDFSSCAAMLAVRPKYTYLDRTLLIVGASRESIGRSTVQDRSDAAVVFFNEYGQNRGFENTPTHVMTLTNAVAESILQVKRAMPGHLALYGLDWVKYYADSYFELKSLMLEETHIREDVQDILRALKERPANFRLRVWLAYLRKASPAQVLELGRAINRYLPVLRRIHQGLRARAGQTRIVRGEEIGFHDILGCRKLLEQPGRG